MHAKALRQELAIIFQVRQDWCGWMELGEQGESPGKSSWEAGKDLIREAPSVRPAESILLPMEPHYRVLTRAGG